MVVGTLYSPTGFFIYRGDTLGYEYEKIKNFAQEKGIALRFVVASSMNVLLELLENDSVHVLVSEIPQTAEFKEKLLHCGEAEENFQVLVQPKGDSLITDVTQLIGKDIYVEQGSKYESRLKNLNSELGGGINIHTIKKDTLIAEDLIEQVSTGQIPFTVVDSDVAKLNKTYYNNININLAISFPQRSSWAVNKRDVWLADSINKWAETAQANSYSKELLKRYFELSKDIPVHPYSVKKGAISPYDDLFRKYAATINWDWHLIAAIAYTESRFDPNVVSWSGARGIMQIMPGTARSYGLDDSNIDDPEMSVMAAVKNLKDLDNILAPKVADKHERMRFILAAYNAGIGHVLDAIALAQKHGKNSQLWYDNVEDAILWKSNPDYYNDEVCRFGYFRGRQTVAYVKTVESHYQYYLSH